MKSPARMTLFRACALLVLVALGGCSGLLNRENEPTSFFVLNPIPRAEQPAAAKDGPTIAVFPVRLPAYLDRTSMVTRMTANELDVAQFDAWGAPLSQNMTSVISENLSTLIPSERVFPGPVNIAIPVRYEVAVDVVEFERDAAGTVRLTARWSLMSDGGRQVYALRRSGFEVRDVPKDYDAISAAMSNLLGELSKDIAAEIRAPRRR